MMLPDRRSVSAWFVTDDFGNVVDMPEKAWHFLSQSGMCWLGEYYGCEWH